MANEVKVGAGAKPKVPSVENVPVRKSELGRNLATAALPDLFTRAHDETVQHLYLGAVEKARAAVAWYSRHVGTKRVGALFLRFGAISLAALATIIPIAAPLFSDDLKKIIPVSSICAALAATFIAVDRFFGYSTGWMRYTAARFEIQARLEKFQMAWCRITIQQESSAQDQLSRTELLTASLATIQELVDGVTASVQAETQAWMAEFKGALAEIDKSVAEAKAGIPAESTACALKVAVEERDKLDEPRQVRIRINDRPEVTSESPVYVVGGLQPAQYVVKVASRRDGKDVAGEDIITLKPGETGTLQVKLG